jgi:hypothetical protein
MLRTELETYEQLLREYERLIAEYEKEIEAYREQEAEGHSDPAVKASLLQDYADLQGLYDRLTASRRSLAETRDATLAAD